MEKILQQNFEVTPGTIASLSITAITLAALPIIFVVLWKKYCGKTVSFTPLFLGAAGFLVSARVLELGVHMICIVWDNPISRFLNGSTPAYVIYGACMAGIFEECGRYVVIKFLMKKNRTRENMVMYGIGHGGIEVWTISLMSVVSLLAIAVVLQSRGVEDTLSFFGVTGAVPENLTDSISTTLAASVNFNALNGVLTVLERVGAMAVHVSLTVVVAYGVLKGQKNYLFLAILTHAAVDTLPALYQRGAVSMSVVEVWLWIWTVLLVIWAGKLYNQFTGAESPG